MADDLKEFANDVAYQFGYYCQNNGRLCITHGGLSTLEWAFDILGWENPHQVPECECEIDGCHEHATCGTPTKDGYKNVCGKHFREIQKGGITMDVREKLVELLRNSPHLDTISDCTFEQGADWLISNGVTVLPVQVGDTVYGRFLPYGEGVQQCEVVKSKLCQFKDRTVRYFLDLEFNIIDPYFNDGRLMRCSTQAVYGADFGNWYRVYLTSEEAESTPPKGGRHD